MSINIILNHDININTIRILDQYLDSMATYKQISTK